MKTRPFILLVLFLLSSCASTPHRPIPSVVPMSGPCSSLENLLKSYRTLTVQGGWPQVSAGPSLRVGEQDSRIKILKKRLAVTGDLRKNNGNPIFDVPLEEALKSFQERHGLEPDGVLGTGTLQALNVPVAFRIRQIESGLKRCQGPSRNWGQRYVEVNIPDFHLRMIQEGREVGSMRVVVGLAKDWQTPVLESRITHLVLNPQWHVPPEILKKEILAQIREDPTYFAKGDMKVFHMREGKKEELDPAAVDWATANPDEIQLIQTEGRGNALGQIKFMFPNPYDVYLHDTPQKQFFNRQVRAFSHGCVRVEKPMELVAFVTQGDPDWDRPKVEAVIQQGKNRWIKLARPVGIHIVYTTAWVDEKGRANFRNDIYDLD